MNRTRCHFPSDILPISTVQVTKSSSVQLHKDERDNETSEKETNMPAAAGGSSSPRREPRQRAPVSCEREHRIVHDTVKHVLQQLRAFKLKFSLDAIDYDACKTCAVDLVSEWGMDSIGDEKGGDDDADSGKGGDSRPLSRSSYGSYQEVDGQVRNWEEFKRLLDKNQVSPKLKKSSDYKQLIRFISSVEKFEKVSANIHSRLVTTLKGHLYKYCVSLAQEPNAYGVKTIREYDERICEYEKDIDAKIIKNRQLYNEYLDLKKPFLGFIDKGNDVNSIIARISETTKQICGLMRDWVDDDREYPDRLLNEILFSQLQREIIVSDIKKYNSKCDDYRIALHKRELQRQKVIRKLEFARRERKKLKASLETVDTQIDRNMAEIDRKLREIEELETQMSKRKTNSPAYINQITTKSDQLKLEVERMTHWNNSHIKQKERLVKNRDAVNDDVSMLEKDLEVHNLAQEDLKQSLDADETKLEKHFEKLKRHENHVDAMKRTRDKKRSPEILKKIYHKKLTEDNKDDLGDACKVVAKSIGKNWISLYEQLPFSPRRDTNQRLRDVEVIDRIGARNDGTHQDLAFQSLRKWRMFHRKGTISELVYSLKRIEQRQLAQKVQRKFVQQES